MKNELIRRNYDFEIRAEKDEKKGKKYCDIEEDYIYEQSKVFDSMAKYKKYEKCF